MRSITHGETFADRACIWSSLGLNTFSFRRYVLILFFGLYMGTPAFAQEPVTITGTWSQSIPYTKSVHQHDRVLSLYSNRSKPISVLKLLLASETKQILAQRIRNITRPVQNPSPPNKTYSPSHVQLGMNDVPVLDQGVHATCMLFAVTAALDAVIGQGDYVSQICYLDLSRYLNHYAYTLNGWNGGWGQDFLSQIDMFGIVSKTTQRTGACMGHTEYPLFGDSLDDELSIGEYYQMSEPMQAYALSFSPLVLANQVNASLVDRERLLEKTKTILQHGDRVTCAVLLLGDQPGVIIPTGSYHVHQDTWVLLPKMAEDLANDTQSAGHAFVITGYDDEAFATDSQGNQHQGLLTLRNSWGAQVGDQGNFYVTYDYFKAALLEAHHIKKI